MSGDNERIRRSAEGVSGSNRTSNSSTSNTTNFARPRPMMDESGRFLPARMPRQGQDQTQHPQQQQHQQQSLSLRNTLRRPNAQQQPPPPPGQTGGGGGDSDSSSDYDPEDTYLGWGAAPLRNDEEEYDGKSSRSLNSKSTAGGAKSGGGSGGNGAVSVTSSVSTTPSMSQSNPTASPSAAIPRLAASRKDTAIHNYRGHRNARSLTSGSSSGGAGATGSGGSGGGNTMDDWFKQSPVSLLRESTSAAPPQQQKQQTTMMQQQQGSMRSNLSAPNRKSYINPMLTVQLKSTPPNLSSNVGPNVTGGYTSSLLPSQQQQQQARTGVHPLRTPRASPSKIEDGLGEEDWKRTTQSLYSRSTLRSQRDSEGGVVPLVPPKPKLSAESISMSDDKVRSTISRRMDMTKTSTKTITSASFRLKEAAGVVTTAPKTGRTLRLSERANTISETAATSSALTSHLRPTRRSTGVTAGATSTLRSNYRSNYRDRVSSSSIATGTGSNASGPLQQPNPLRSKHPLRSSVRDTQSRLSSSRTLSNSAILSITPSPADDPKPKRELDKTAAALQIKQRRSVLSQSSNSSDDSNSVDDIDLSDTSEDDDDDDDDDIENVSYSDDSQSSDDGDEKYSLRIKLVSAVDLPPSLTPTSPLCPIFKFGLLEGGTSATTGTSTNLKQPGSVSVATTDTKDDDEDETSDDDLYEGIADVFSARADDDTTTTNSNKDKDHSGSSLSRCRLVRCTSGKTILGRNDAGTAEFCEEIRFDVEASETILQTKLIVELCARAVLIDPLPGMDTSSVSSIGSSNDNLVTNGGGGLSSSLSGRPLPASSSMSQTQSDEAQRSLSSVAKNAQFEEGAGNADDNTKHLNNTERGLRALWSKGRQRLLQPELKSQGSVGSTEVRKTSKIINRGKNDIANEMEAASAAAAVARFIMDDTDDAQLNQQQGKGKKPMKKSSTIESAMSEHTSRKGKLRREARKQSNAGWVCDESTSSSEEFDFENKDEHDNKRGNKTATTAGSTRSLQHQQQQQEPQLVEDLRLGALTIPLSRLPFEDAYRGKCATVSRWYGMEYPNNSNSKSPHKSLMLDMASGVGGAGGKPGLSNKRCPSVFLELSFSSSRTLDDTEELEMKNASEKNKLENNSLQKQSKKQKTPKKSEQSSATQKPSEVTEPTLQPGVTDFIFTCGVQSIGNQRNDDGGKGWVESNPECVLLEQFPPNDAYHEKNGRTHSVLPNKAEWFCYPEGCKLWRGTDPPTHYDLRQLHRAQGQSTTSHPIAGTSAMAHLAASTDNAGGGGGVFHGTKNPITASFDACLKCATQLSWFVITSTGENFGLQEIKTHVVCVKFYVPAPYSIDPLQDDFAQDYLNNGSGNPIKRSSGTPTATSEDGGGSADVAGGPTTIPGGDKASSNSIATASALLKRKRLWIPMAIGITSRLPIVGVIEAMLLRLCEALASVYSSPSSSSISAPLRHYNSFKSPSSMITSTNNRAKQKTIMQLIHREIVDVILNFQSPIRGVLHCSIPFLSGDRLHLTTPPPSGLPSLPHGACITQVARLLGAEGLTTLLAAVLTECKILLHSSSIANLSMVSEVITTLIYPFHWSLPYIPVLPEQMLEFVEAPLSYLLGVPSCILRWIDSEALHDVVVFDLDSLGGGSGGTGNAGPGTAGGADASETFYPNRPHESSYNHAASATTPLTTFKRPTPLPASISSHITKLVFRLLREEEEVEEQYSRSRTGNLNSLGGYGVNLPLRSASGATMGSTHSAHHHRASLPHLEAESLAEREFRVGVARQICGLMRGYQDCIFFVSSDQPVFNRDRFLRQAPALFEAPRRATSSASGGDGSKAGGGASNLILSPRAKRFLSLLVNTQNFHGLLERLDAEGVAFFHEIMDTYDIVDADENDSGASGGLTLIKNNQQNAVMSNEEAITKLCKTLQEIEDKIPTYRVLSSPIDVKEDGSAEIDGKSTAAGGDMGSVSTNISNANSARLQRLNPTMSTSARKNRLESFLDDSGDESENAGGVDGGGVNVGNKMGGVGLGEQSLTDATGTASDGAIILFTQELLRPISAITTILSQPPPPSSLCDKGNEDESITLNNMKEQIKQELQKQPWEYTRLFDILGTEVPRSDSPFLSMEGMGSPPASIVSALRRRPEITLRRAIGERRYRQYLTFLRQRESYRDDTMSGIPGVNSANGGGSGGTNAALAGDSIDLSSLLSSAEGGDSNRSTGLLDCTGINKSLFDNLGGGGFTSNPELDRDDQNKVRTCLERAYEGAQHRPASAAKRNSGHHMNINKQGGHSNSAASGDGENVNFHDEMGRDLIQEAESALRNPAAQRFLVTVLSQRARLENQRKRRQGAGYKSDAESVNGGSAVGHHHHHTASVSRLVPSAFECLIRLCCAMLEACMEEQDYDSAYRLLTHTAGFCTLIAKAPTTPPPPVGEIASQPPDEEVVLYMTQRIGMHAIYSDLRLWERVLLIHQLERQNQDRANNSTTAPGKSANGGGKEDAVAEYDAAVATLYEMVAYGIPSEELAKFATRVSEARDWFNTEHGQTLLVLARRLSTRRESATGASTTSGSAADVDNASAISGPGGTPSAPMAGVGEKRIGALIPNDMGEAIWEELAWCHPTANNITSTTIVPTSFSAPPSRQGPQSPTEATHNPHGKSSNTSVTQINANRTGNPGFLSGFIGGGTQQQQAQKQSLKRSQTTPMSGSGQHQQLFASKSLPASSSLQQKQQQQQPSKSGVLNARGYNGRSAITCLANFGGTVVATGALDGSVFLGHTLRFASDTINSNESQLMLSSVNSNGSVNARANSNMLAIPRQVHGVRLEGGKESGAVTCLVAARGSVHRPDGNTAASSSNAGASNAAIGGGSSGSLSEEFATALEGCWIIAGTTGGALRIWSVKDIYVMTTAAANSEMALSRNANQNNPAMMSTTDALTVAASIQNNTSDSTSTTATPSTTRATSSTLRSGHKSMANKLKWSLKGRALSGHRGGVTCVDVPSPIYRPDSLISGGADGMIRLWSLRHARRSNASMTAKGKNDTDATGAAARLGLGRGGSDVRAGGGAGKVANSANDAQSTLAGHKGRVLCVRTAWHGDQLLSGGADKTVRIWDLANGSNNNSSTGGNRGGGGGSGTAASATPTQCLRTLNGHSGWVTHVHYWGANNIVSASTDRSISLWDARVQHGSGPLFALRYHRSPVSDLLVGSRTEPIMISSGSDGSIATWDFRMLSSSAKGSSSNKSSAANTKTISGGTGTAGAAGFATTTQIVRTPGITMDQYLQNAGFRASGSVLLCRGISALNDTTATGTVLSASIDGRIKEWDVTSGKCINDTVSGHNDAISCLTSFSDSDGLLRGTSRFNSSQKIRALGGGQMKRSSLSSVASNMPSMGGRGEDSSSVGGTITCSWDGTVRVRRLKYLKDRMGKHQQ